MIILTVDEVIKIHGRLIEKTGGCWNRLFSVYPVDLGR